MAPEKTPIQKPITSRRKFFAEWFKTAFLQSWGVLGHLTRLRTIISGIASAVVYCALIANWLANWIKQPTLNAILAIAPVAFWLLSFLWHLLCAPYQLYRQLEEKANAPKQPELPPQVPNNRVDPTETRQVIGQAYGKLIFLQRALEANREVLGDDRERKAASARTIVELANDFVDYIQPKSIFLPVSLTKMFEKVYGLLWQAGRKNGMIVTFERSGVQSPDNLVKLLESESNLFEKIWKAVPALEQECRRALGLEAEPEVLGTGKKRDAINHLGKLIQEVQRLSGRLRVIHPSAFDETKEAEFQDACIAIGERNRKYIQEHLEPFQFATYASQKDRKATPLSGADLLSPFAERIRKHRAFLDLLNHEETSLDNVIESLR
jgi:hypothetical protein